MTKERLIVLDTETTGLSPQNDRVIEIGCVEILDRKVSNNHKRWYINPQQSVSADSFAIHGLSDEFLSNKPPFDAIANPLLDFIQGATLIAHNASFDIGFINAELSRCNQSSLNNEVIDTLKIARKKHFGQPNNLDALCKRYFIENSNRDLHGALLDAQLLAQVYLSMHVKQHQFFTQNNNPSTSLKTEQKQTINPAQLHLFQVIKASENEINAHQKFEKNYLT